MPSKVTLLRSLEKERILVKTLQERLAFLESENENLRLPQVAWEEGVYSRVQKSGVELTSKIAKLQKLTAGPSMADHPLPMLPPMGGEGASVKPLMTFLSTKYHSKSASNLSTTGGGISLADDRSMSTSVTNKRPGYQSQQNYEMSNGEQDYLSDFKDSEQKTDRRNDEDRFFNYEWSHSTSTFVSSLINSMCGYPQITKKRKLSTQYEIV